MSISGVNNSLSGIYQYAGKTQKTTASRTSFMDMLQKTESEEETLQIKTYQQYLEKRYGTVTVKDVGKDQRSIDEIGASTTGYNNVVIAPNILKQMASDPEKAAYYEDKIRSGLDNFSKVQAEMSAAGFEVYSYGVGIEADGTVYTYVSGDLKPEVRAKIEAKIKAEQEEKIKRKKKYQEQSKKAAELRKLELEIAYKRQNITDFLTGQSEESGWFTYAGTPTNISSIISAYKMNINGGIF